MFNSKCVWLLLGNERNLYKLPEKVNTDPIIYVFELFTFFKFRNGGFNCYSIEYPKNWTVV